MVGNPTQSGEPRVRGTRKPKVHRPSRKKAQEQRMVAERAAEHTPLVEFRSEEEVEADRLELERRATEEAVDAADETHKLMPLRSREDNYELEAETEESIGGQLAEFESTLPEDPLNGLVEVFARAELSSDREESLILHDPVVQLYVRGAFIEVLNNEGLLVDEDSLNIDLNGVITFHIDQVGDVRFEATPEHLTSLPGLLAESRDFVQLITDIDSALPGGGESAPSAEVVLDLPYVHINGLEIPSSYVKSAEGAGTEFDMYVANVTLNSDGIVEGLNITSEVTWTEGWSRFPQLRKGMSFRQWQNEVAALGYAKEYVEEYIEEARENISSGDFGQDETRPEDSRENDPFQDRADAKIVAGVEETRKLRRAFDDDRDLAGRRGARADALAVDPGEELDPDGE